MMSSPERGNVYAEPVHDALKHYGLIDTRFFVEGDASLALRGILEATRLKVVLARSDWRELAQEGQTPSEVALVPAATSLPLRERLSTADTPPEGILPMDIYTFSHPGHRIRFAYLHRAAQQLESPAGPIRVVKPLYELSRTTEKTTQGRQKRTLINDHYDFDTGRTG